MKLTKYEQETIINFNNDEQEASIYTASPQMMRKLDALAAAYRELTAEDKRFLIAMLDDEEESTTANLVERLKRSPQQVSRYRRRMIDAGIIGERGRGLVAFELPFFRDYLAAQCVK